MAQRAEREHTRDLHTNQQHDHKEARGLQYVTPNAQPKGHEHAGSLGQTG